MSAVYVNGSGAVSPAGWGVEPLRAAVEKSVSLPPTMITREGRDWPVPVLKAPPPLSKPPFLAHPRLRRSSSISQFAMAAACEALEGESGAPRDTKSIGVIVTVFSGCVNYSRRFYDEVLKNPATASPMLFPETVFNAPASHVSAFLGSSAINYTMVGDKGTYIVALATAANWIVEGRVDECLVIGAEEIDWLSAEALALFPRQLPLSEGAGALLLSAKAGKGVALDLVTSEFLYSQHGRASAGEQMLKELSSPRQNPAIGNILGEGLMASTAWECVLAADSLAANGSHRLRSVPVQGFHQHAVGARFERI